MGHVLLSQKIDSLSIFLASLSVDGTTWPHICLHVALQPAVGLRDWIQRRYRVYSLSATPQAPPTPDLCTHHVSHLVFRTVPLGFVRRRTDSTSCSRSCRGAVSCQRFAREECFLKGASPVKKTAFRQAERQLDNEPLIQCHSGVKSGTDVLMMNAALSLFTREVFCLSRSWTQINSKPFVFMCPTEKSSRVIPH